MKTNNKENKNRFENYIRTVKGLEKEKVERYLARMNSGKSILILGAFCPLFWFSLLSGHSKGVVLFNLFHSLIYVIIGYFMYNSSKKSIVMMLDKSLTGKKHNDNI